jgi:hypothetical protein
MQRGGSQQPQGLPVLSRAIPHVPFQTIAGETGGQAVDHQPIPSLLGQHTGRGNRRAEAITPHKGALGARPAPQRQRPVHNH